MNFEFLKVQQEQKVAEVTLMRPDKANALNEKLWNEIGTVFASLDKTPEVRAIVLKAEGPHFCAGIDFEFVGSISKRMQGMAEGQKQETLRLFIKSLQHAFTALEACRKPVIAAVQGVCFGGGIDLIAACDIRHASSDASFSVKEVDVGMVADVGTLQRLPPIIGQGRARELAFTGRVFTAAEAQSMGLINQLVKTKDEVWTLAREQAQLIASKSPLAVRGTKEILNYSRDHSISDGLDYVATWNAGMLLSADMQKSVMAFLTKKPAVYDD